MYRRIERLSPLYIYMGVESGDSRTLPVLGDVSNLFYARGTPVVYRLESYI